MRPFDGVDSLLALQGGVRTLISLRSNGMRYLALGQFLVPIFPGNQMAAKMHRLGKKHIHNDRAESLTFRHLREGLLCLLRVLLICDQRASFLKN